MEFGTFVPYLIAGPRIDFEINDNITVDGPRGEARKTFRKQLFGFKIGLGTEVDLPTIRLLIDIVYDSICAIMLDMENL